MRTFSHLAGCTLSAELVLDGLHASLLLDEVVDDLGGLLVLQLGLGDAAHVEQVLQLWVQVVHLEDKRRRRSKNLLVSLNLEAPGSFQFTATCIMSCFQYVDVPCDFIAFNLELCGSPTQDGEDGGEIKQGQTPAAQRRRQT